MSRHCRSALSLVQRCVTARQLTFTAATNSGGSGRRLLQQPAWTWVSRAGCLHSLRGLQPPLTRSQRNLCTKATCEEEYPPLPFYNTDAESHKKDVYIIQVKGLPWSCTAHDILQFFSECRIRDGENGIHLTEDRLGRPSGRAFIEVEHEDDVRKALEKHRQYLGARYVEVFEVTNDDAEVILKKALHTPSDKRVVRLRGLPFSSTEDDIRYFFRGLDILENGIFIVKDKRGRNSGTGFVWFSSQEAADTALQRNREMMGNRYIELFPSGSSEIRSSWRGAAPPQTNQPPMHPDPPSPSPLPTPSASASPTAPRPDSSPAVAAGSSYSPQHFLHMRGLPFNVSGEDIVQFFSPLLVSKIVIECGPDGRPSGEASVYFRCHQDAVAAMSKDRMHMGERYIELFLNSTTDGEES